MPNVFLCYARTDADTLDELIEQLATLKGLGVDPWSDQDIETGADWRDKIHAALDAADIAVLLISARFLNSKFIKEVELPPIAAGRADHRRACRGGPF
ncbi:hypothetical protein AIOL_004226 [Candidatus Rhodobacter oscarellae]|uniref:TIR domain-containing protein n=2 Tax=Candidatus Rhodobacter oscarellae TaxID=1675527 RepID=A0A0J9E8X9_9RHOB|nr:hypothetical protein AIOL_004226 [Candidatus Rhodobacter lobularis]